MINKKEFIKIVDNRYFKHLINKTSDPFDSKYKEIGWKKTVEKTYDELIHDITGYKPKPLRSYISHPKSKYVIRKLPSFELEDYLIYYYCIKSLEDLIAKNRIVGTFGGFRLGGKIRKKEEREMVSEVTFFESFNQNSFNYIAWKSQYISYTTMLRDHALLLDNPDSNFNYGIHLDIANFYDCIEIHSLKKKIEKEQELSENPVSYNDPIFILFNFLENWGVNNNINKNRTVGIPQDEVGDCSRLLANFYLQNFDKKVEEECRRQDIKYFRFADDMMFFASSNKQITDISFYVSNELFEEGLNINSNKVYTFSAYDDLDSRFGFEIFNELSKEEVILDKVWGMFERYVNKSKNFRESSVLKRLLSKDYKTSELNSRNKIRFISRYWDEDFLLFSGDFYLKRVYSLLSESQKADFIEYLDEINDKYNFDTFKNDLKKFKQELN